MTAAAKPAPAPQPVTRSVPFWLPAAHFVTGLILVSAAALLLPAISDDLAAGRFLAPHVLGVVHLVTLGWLTVSIMGALCQLFPVVLNTSLYSIRLAVASLTLIAAGLALFVAGLLSGATTSVLAGAVLLSTALVLFIYNGFRTLRRSKTRDLTWWALAAAFGFLMATVAFGASLALNLKTAHLGTERITALAVHVHVAVAGWVGLVIMAVGRRLLPMFLLSHGTDERPLRIAVISNMSGAGLLALFHRALNDALFKVAAAFLIVGAIALCLQIVGYLRSRHRPQLDAGLRLVIAGAGLILLALLPALIMLVIGGSNRLITTYGVALIGGLLLFVAGHYYKILPFLLWNHRFAPHAGKRALPRIVDLYDGRIAAIAGAASTVGMISLAIAVLLRAAPLATIAAVLVAAGILLQAGQLILLLRTKLV